MIEKANRISGISSYYFASKLAEIRQMNVAGDQVINLGIGSPDLPAPISVKDKLCSVINDSEIDKYQSYRGLPELREAFANWYKNNFSVQASSETEILPLLGSKEGIMHISMAFLNPGDEVLIPNPGYPAYSAISKICGANVKEYDLTPGNGYQINISALEQGDLSKVKIMWINYPHMPTGTVADPKVFEALVKLAQKNNFIICHDNPYAFVLNNEPISIFEFDKEKSVSIELSSLSKHYNMAGWRVGCLTSNPTYIDHVLTFKSNMDSGMFKGIQLAAIEALNLDNGWFDSQNEIYKKRRELIYTFFDNLNCTFERNNAGLFVWAKIPDDYKNGELFSEAILQKHKVFITPGFIFGSNGDQYVRASICQPESIINKATERCK